jgi:protein involved in polysaccharide export with SLBB domain
MMIPGRTMALEGPIDSESYILGPNDQIAISLWGEINESQVEPVSPDGMILVAPVGKVEASGLTLKELEERLLTRLSAYYRDVKVTVSLYTMRYVKVFVLGEVERPNIYTVQPVNRVSELIELAGGITLNGALDRVQYEQADGRVDTLNLFRFAYDGVLADNPMVQSGSRVFVPRKQTPVFLRGAIRGYQLFWNPFNRSPQSRDRSVDVSFGYELLPGEGIGDLVRKAGGLSPDADLGAAYLERYGTGADVGEGMSRGVVRLELRLGPDGEITDSSGTILKVGDTVVIPRIRDLVYVEGSVSRPGPIPFNPNYEVRDYVGLAGGISRMGKTDKWTVLGLDGIRRPADHDDPVERGEVIFVPERTAFWVQEMISPLTSIVSLSLSVVALLTVL